MLIAFPIFSLGQNRLVQDKIVRADAIKSEKGICAEYVDALMVASDEAFNENEMESALQIQKELLTSIKKVYPSDLDLINTTEVILAMLYQQCEQYSESYPLLKKAYEREKGEDIESDLETLELLSYSAYKLHLYPEAINYRKEKIELIQTHLGKCVSYAENLYLLASLYLDINELDNVLMYTKASIEMFRMLNETSNDIYLRAIQRINDLDPQSDLTENAGVRKEYMSYMSQYFDTEDVKYIQLALDILSQTPENNEVIEYRYHAMVSLYLHYMGEQNDSQAIEVILNLPYMTSSDWFSLGRAMSNIGDFYNAKESYKYAWAKSYDENKDVTDKFYTYFEFYAQACINIGEYQEPFGYLETFYANDITVQGREIKAALYMYILAQLKESIGDYSGAADCAKKCGELFLNAGIYHEYELCQLIELEYYEGIGDFDSCIKGLENLMNVSRSSDSIMKYKAMLPFYHLLTGDINKAKEVYETVNDAYKTYTFTDPAEEGIFFQGLGMYSQNIKDNIAAEAFYRKAIECLKRVEYPDYVNYSTGLLTLASMYLKWPGQEIKATPLCEEAFEVIKRHYDASYPSYYAFSFNNIYAKYVNALPITNKEVRNLIEEERIQAQNLLCQMTEAERESFWKHHNYTKDLIFSLDQSADMLYDYTLFYKGILLSSTRQIGRIVQIANDNELNSLYGRYITEKQLNDVSNPGYLDQIRHLERQLLARCKDLGYVINDALNYSDVAKALKRGEIAIEFVDYKKLSTAADTLEQNKYVALIANKEWNSPKCIELCTEDQLSDLVLLQDKAYADDALYHLLWEPIEKYIPKGAKVYYSPAGLTHKISFEAIKFDRKSILSDIYKLKRVSSTRELCTSATDNNVYTSSSVYGGLIYNVPTEEFVQNSQHYAGLKGYRNATLTTRGNEARNAWRFLPGTRNEAETIYGLLHGANIPCDLYVGSKGNEESFKSLSGNSPAIIHVATHGFYIEPSQASVSEVGKGIRGQIMNEESALRRSGLIMAGANAAWTNGVKLANVDDGVLTAEEISQMDLRNTILAIVSACESGLGNITNDGIEGLVRGFKSAGVKSVIVTLWKVDDAATELMMTSFYKNLTQGKSREESFVDAQNSVRAKYQEPYYWAPFVLID